MRMSWVMPQSRSASKSLGLRVWALGISVNIGSPTAQRYIPLYVQPSSGYTNKYKPQFQAWTQGSHHQLLYIPSHGAPQTDLEKSWTKLHVFAWCCHAWEKNYIPSGLVISHSYGKWIIETVDLPIPNADFPVRYINVYLLGSASDRIPGQSFTKTCEAMKSGATRVRASRLLLIVGLAAHWSRYDAFVGRRYLAPVWMWVCLTLVSPTCMAMYI